MVVPVSTVSTSTTFFKTIIAADDGTVKVVDFCVPTDEDDDNEADVSLTLPSANGYDFYVAVDGGYDCEAPPPPLYDCEAPPASDEFADCSCDDDASSSSASFYSTTSTTSMEGRKGGRRVRFADNLVSAVREREYTTPEEQEILFFNSEDYKRFRKEYRAFVRAKANKNNKTSCSNRGTVSSSPSSSSSASSLSTISSPLVVLSHATSFVYQMMQMATKDQPSDGGYMETTLAVL